MVLAITECKASCVILLDFDFELCMFIPYYHVDVNFILSRPFYWHFEFSAVSAELDCHSSATSLVLDLADLELTLNNVPRFNSKSASLLSVF